MITALVHAVGPAFARCELTFVARQPIDVPLAARQHAEYCRVLEACGVRVRSVSVSPEHPDAVFVEDAVVMLDEIAIATAMGAASRRGEVDNLLPVLERERKVVRLGAQATLEGGDVLRIGRTLYVGESRRTNAAGIAALAEIVVPLDYRVVVVPVHGCLHLKTACTALDARTVIVNPRWIDTSWLADCELLTVPTNEPFGANTLTLCDTVLVSATHPLTAALIASTGRRVRSVGISELEKAEAGLTCLCVVFES